MSVVKIGGTPVNSPLDTGSEVTTITEEFFNLHYKPKGQTLLSASSWLTLTAANGLEIPYAGYIELDVEVEGVILEQRGILAREIQQAFQPDSKRERSQDWLV